MSTRHLEISTLARAIITLSIARILSMSLSMTLGAAGAHPQNPPATASPANRSAVTGQKAAATAPTVKADPKKAKESYKRGLKAEQDGDWESAHEAYSDAVNWEPTEREYLLRRDVATSHLVQAKVDLAERDAVSGRLKDARKELIDASYLDPDQRNGARTPDRTERA